MDKNIFIMLGIGQPIWDKYFWTDFLNSITNLNNDLIVNSTVNHNNV